MFQKIAWNVSVCRIAEKMFETSNAHRLSDSVAKAVDTRVRYSAGVEIHCNDLGTALSRQYGGYTDTTPDIEVTLTRSNAREDMFSEERGFRVVLRRKSAGKHQELSTKNRDFIGFLVALGRIESCLHATDERRTFM
jgi:hypothetical protein